MATLPRKREGNKEVRNILEDRGEVDDFYNRAIDNQRGFLSVGKTATSKC